MSLRKFFSVMHTFTKSRRNVGLPVGGDVCGCSLSKEENTPAVSPEDWKS